MYAALRRLDDEAVSLASDAVHRTRHPPLHSAARAFRLEHRDDVERGAVAEELAELLLVVGDAVTLDETDELRRRVACERRAAEIRVLRQKVRRPRVDVREVAPAAAGDADLFADDVIVLDEQHPAAALSGLRSAHHAGGPSADRSEERRVGKERS